MSYSVTTVLELQLAVVGSGQVFETTVVNANFTKIDTAIGDLQEQVDNIGSIVVYATTAALDAVEGPRGTLAVLQSSAITGLQHDLLMRCGAGTGFVWAIETSPVVFDTKANLDSLVTTHSARLRAGQTFWVQADSGREYTYDGSALRPTSVLVASSAPDNPVTDQLWADKS
jgi:hypothetical protein